MRAAFPGVSVETAEYWKDLKILQRPFVFERAMVVDRRAAHRQYVVLNFYIVLMIEGLLAHCQGNLGR